MKRIIKGLKHIDQVAEGVYNFKFPKDCIEKKALERSKVCESCPNFAIDPINDFHVTDRIESLSKKMCNLCGCVLSYKLRINKITTENCPLNDKI
jgi:hypothetical protein